MGNYCSECERKVDSGKYCDGCYERMYPSCTHCRKPLLSNQAIVGSYHKFPCYKNYSQRFGLCCNCDNPIDYRLNRAYCTNCYNSKYPPPLRFHGTYQGCEITLYLRDDEFNSKLKPLAYAFGRGLSDRGKPAHFLTDY